MTKLEWNDTQIPHQIHLESLGQRTSLTVTIIKDVEPEILTLILDTTLEQLQSAWDGTAHPVSEAFDDGKLYSQVRCLFNLERGCVAWMVNHIKLPNGNKMSADRLVWVPNMKSCSRKLIDL